MKLSLLQVQGNQTYMDVAGKDADAVSEGLKNGMKEIASKTPGQTISGEVVGKNGNDLIISIGKNQLLHAKLDSGVMVEQGSQMSFAIKSIDNPNQSSSTDLGAGDHTITTICGMTGFHTVRPPHIEQ